MVEGDRLKVEGGALSVSKGLRWVAMLCLLWLTGCVAPAPTPTLILSPDTLTPDTPLPSPTLTLTPVLAPTLTLSPSPSPTAENSPVLQFPAHDLVHDVRWSPDGSQLVIAAGTDIHLYDSKFNQQRIISLGLWAERLAFHPSQPIVGAALKDGSVRFWSSANGDEICKFTAHAKGANSLSFQPGGDLLATTGTDIISRTWDISSVLAGGCDVKEVGQLIGSSFTAPTITFSADGQTFALVDIKDVYLRESQSRKLISFLHTELSIFDIALSPNGHWLAAAQNDSTLTLWDLTVSPRPTPTLLHFPSIKPKAYTWRVAFNADGSLLAAITSTGDLQVWSLPGLEPVFSRSLGHPLSALSFHPNTSALTVGGLDGSVYLYPLK